MVGPCRRQTLVLILIKARGAIRCPSLIAMKAKRFIVAERPRLAAITEHPKVPFAEYELSCAQCNSLCKQSNRPISERERGRWSSLKDGTPQARAELFGGSAGLWIHEASKSIRLRRRCRTRRVSTTFSAFGRSFPTRPNRRVRSLLVRARLGREGGGNRQQAGMAERLRGDQSIRTNAGRRWRSNCEMFSPHHSGRANPKV